MVLVCWVCLLIAIGMLLYCYRLRDKYRVALALKEAAEDTSLQSINIDIRVMQSYMRILTNSTISDRQKLQKLEKVTNSRIRLDLDAMSLLYTGYGRSMPVIWQELHDSIQETNTAGDLIRGNR